MSYSVLELQGLTNRWSSARHTGFIFRVKACEIHALIGPNGAGKTTVVQQIYGALKPDAGRVLFNGRDISNLPVPDRVRAGIGRSFQISNCSGFYRFGECDHRRANAPRAELSVSAACF